MQLMTTPAKDETYAHRIASRLDEIERLIAVGVYHESICKVIGLEGISADTFRKTLARARQKRVRGQGERPTLSEVAHTGRRLTAEELAALEASEVAAAR